MLKVSTEEFIEKAIKIHGNKYDYSLVVYHSVLSKIKLICPKHGEFVITPKSHLQARGCSKCYGNKLLTREEFITKANEVHSNRYDYSLVVYKNQRTKIIIKCKLHGDFEQTPKIHLNNHGCPFCKTSIGETTIRQILNHKNIIFVEQKRFKDCKSINTLAFDFYLPDHNICIEYDGEQHFRPISFGTDKTKETKLKNLKEIQMRDNIKNRYCIDNNINILRISFKESIEDKLSTLGIF